MIPEQSEANMRKVSMNWKRKQSCAEFREDRENANAAFRWPEVCSAEQKGQNITKAQLKM